MGRVFVILIITIFILSCSSKDDSTESIISENDWIVDEIDVTGEFFISPFLKPKF